ncbi:MAG: non-canonical purine NTP pyrophosphatase [Planctomycetales bacterium]|nr:non-canonical purine NTP pyrophosphatase [Planctomycetales bacterium]
MESTPTIVLGTTNRKKGGELAELLGGLKLEIQTLQAYPEALDVVEDGSSFADNARRKAVQQALHLRRWVLGEDSGIGVDALGGAPGIYSARFAGEAATDEANNQHLLKQLGDTPLEQRTAHYTCHMTLSDPRGQVRAESEAYCRGRILFAPIGTGGFGYDPLFEILEYHRTFGQMGPAAKAALSHRARAARALRPQLRRLIQEGEWVSS